MKYILTIDAEKKEVSVRFDRPIFLRTGHESLMELERRKRISREYENANLPDWLHDEILIIEAKLDELNPTKEKQGVGGRCVVIHDIP